jgi:23S rRNA pseudouridine1911/1915/1917 synthase
MTSHDDFSIQAGAAEAGLRLDVFVGAHLAGRSRSFAAQLILSGHVQVGGHTRKPGYRLKAGDIVTGCLPPPRPTGLQPEPVPLHILYEDAHIVVLNKQPGLVVHPAPGHYSGTLVNGLLHHCPDLGRIGEDIRPGIVHRLDKDTSRTLVVAKHAAALDHLARQFKARSVSKEYLALVHGVVAAESGTLQMPIGRHPVDRKRMSIRSRRAREAETAWKVARRLKQSTLLEVRLKTGRTHQIRVHLAAMGHPVVGDPLYGSRRELSRTLVREGERSAVRRQMLHAWRLGFVHPFTGEPMQFESPLPEDMERLIADLEGGSGKAEGGNARFIPNP